MFLVGLNTKLRSGKEHFTGSNHKSASPLTIF